MADPKREFTEAANGAQYHVVTEETLGRGEVATVAQRSRAILPGDVLVATDRPEVFAVYSAGEWADMGVEAGEGVEAEKKDTAFHANEHSAVEVRAYLMNEDIPQEERDRVRAEEVAGPNRRTALG